MSKHIEHDEITIQLTNKLVNQNERLIDQLETLIETNAKAIDRLGSARIVTSSIEIEPLTNENDNS